MSFIWDLIPNMQADNYSILVAQQIYIYLSIILKLVNKECLLTRVRGSAAMLLYG